MTPDQFKAMGGVPDSQSSNNSLPPPPQGVKGISSHDFVSMGGKVDTPPTDPNKTAALLGAPTPSPVESMMSSVGNAAGSAASAVGNFESDASTGVAKGVISTANNFGKMGEWIGNQTVGRVANLMTGKGFTAPSMSDPDLGKVLNVDLTPQNPGEAVGKTAEQVGEFFVPGQGEKAVFEKGASLIEKIPEAIGLSGKAATALTGVLKTAFRAGVTGASTAGVTAAQTGDLNQAKSAGEAGGLLGGAGQALESFGSGLLTSLQKSGFKLSPSAEAKAASKSQSAAEFMAKNKITGTGNTKFAKLNNITTFFEDTLQSSLPKKLQINTDAISSHINQSLDALKRSDPAVYSAASKDAKQAMGILKSKGNSIDVGEVLNGKRSYGKQAFKQSKFFDPKVVSEGSYAVEQGYQKALEDTLSSTKTPIKIPSSQQSYFGGKSEVTLPEFNKVYSQAISAKNLTNIGRFKKDSGLVGRLFGLWAGESLGQAIAPGLGGKIVGGAVGEMASTKLPGMVRNVSERVLSSGSAIPKVGKTVMGVSDANATPSNQVQQQ